MSSRTTRSSQQAIEHSLNRRDAQLTSRRQAGGDTQPPTRAATRQSAGSSRRSSGVPRRRHQRVEEDPEQTESEEEMYFTLQEHMRRNKAKGKRPAEDQQQEEEVETLCLLGDDQSLFIWVMKGAVRSESTEVIVGESTEDVVERISGVDFMVVDSKRHEFIKALGLAKMSKMDAVLVCKNATQKSIPGFRWHRVLRRGTRVVRSVFLPVGGGLDIAHMGASGNNDLKKLPSRWIKYIDPQSGEEHLFKR
ncbi:PREDICTED: uncharacterized protein LOC104784048 [Camelina sativa]|uniref:Uncharacterized protein LOC104784048 n=1 Tax=Camelina sativa TaxID=90675 RepID=A0ABM0YXG3_CAMSA|nr:PREDICTED: uncharacterized protein LOC104784048 [Camelina sativa]